MITAQQAIKAGTTDQYDKLQKKTSRIQPAARQRRTTAKHWKKKGRPKLNQLTPQRRTMKGERDSSLIEVNITKHPKILRLIQDYSCMLVFNNLEIYLSRDKTMHRIFIIECILKCVSEKLCIFRICQVQTTLTFITYQPKIPEGRTYKYLKET